jgi:hypothetical protein
MRNLVHSDNLGRVGWTCIHAFLTWDDMFSLQKAIPEGTFTQTFYTLQRVDSLQSFRAHLTTKVMKGVTEAPFYFSFPNDSKGKELLTSLGLGEPKQ